MRMAHYSFQRRQFSLAAVIALAQCGPAPERTPITPTATPSPPLVTAAPVSSGASLPLPDEYEGPVALVLQLGPKRGTSEAVFSPDGSVLVAGAYDGSIRLWDIKTGELRGVVGRSDAGVDALAYRADGALIASGHRYQSTVQLWDPHTGRNAGTFQPKEVPDDIEALYFDPEGLTVFGEYNSEVRACTQKQLGKCVRMPLSTQYAGHVVRSPDGKQVAIATTQGKHLQVFDATTGRVLKTMEGFEGWPERVAFSPNGDLLAGGGFSQPIVAWDLTNPSTKMELARPHNELFGGIIWSKDGSVLAASWGTTLAAWEMPAGKQHYAIRLGPKSANGLARSLDGDLIATVNYDDPVRLFRLRDGSKVRSFGDDNGQLQEFAWTPNGQGFLVSSVNGPSRACKLDGDRVSCLSLGTTAALAGIFTVKDGTEAAMGTLDGISFYDTNNPNRMDRVPIGCKVSAAAVSRDGERAAASCGGSDNNIYIGERRTGVQKQLSGHTRSPRPLVFSPDGRTLASGDAAGTIILWDVDTGRRRKNLERDTSYIQAMAWSPNGEWLAVSAGGAILVWDVQLGRIVKSAKTDPSITALAFHPNGTVLATGDSSGGISLWEMATTKRTRRFPSLEGPVSGIGFDASGALLAASGVGARLVRLVDGMSLGVESFRAPQDEALLFYTDDGLVEGNDDALAHVRYRGAGDWVTAPIIGVDRVKKRFVQPGLLARFLRGDVLSAPR